MQATGQAADAPSTGVGRAFKASPITPPTEPLTPPDASVGCPAAFAVPVPRFATAFLAAPHQVPVPHDEDGDLLAPMAEA